MLYEEGSLSIREKLESDELDFGIIIVPDNAPNLNVLKMSRNQLMVCVAQTSPLADKEKITPKEIAASDLIMMKEGAYLREVVQNKLLALKISPRTVLESSQIVTIKGLVAHNVGIAFLLDFICENSSDIKTIPFYEPIFVDIGLAWKKERYVSKAAQAFIDFCKAPL